ncbi:Alpha/Beta hydrolase fold [Amanita muscaria]
MIYEKLITLSGIEFAYTDSGVPSQPQYATIIAVHGMIFCAPVFKRAQEVAFKRGVRFIAINRRNYPGSTPFTPEEFHTLEQGSSEEKAEFWRDRGHEIAVFIDAFIKENNIPPIPNDGQSGGIILLGWSLGCGEANTTVAHVDTLPPLLCSRLAAYIRALILYDASPRVLGLPVTVNEWGPFHGERIPPELRAQASLQWTTAYFEHGDLSARDPNALSFTLPSTGRPVTIHNMSQSDQEEIIQLQELANDSTFIRHLTDQRRDAYRKAFYDSSIRQLLPNMKVSYIVGEQSHSVMISGLWDVQKEADENKNVSIDFRLVPGFNHFAHWDEPERAVDLFLECAVF